MRIKNRGMQVATAAVMHHRIVSLTELAAVNGARGLAGLGLGLLIAHRIERRRRMYAGWSLLAIGTAVVLPLGLRILMRKNHQRRADETRSANGRSSEPVVVA